MPRPLLRRALPRRRRHRLVVALALLAVALRPDLSDDAPCAPVRAAADDDAPRTLSEQLARSERAVRIPADAALPAAQRGDRIDLVGRTAAGTRSLDDAARVLSSDDGGLTIAVASGAAGEIGAAIAEGTLVVVVAPRP